MKGGQGGFIQACGAGAVRAARRRLASASSTFFQDTAWVSTAPATISKGSPLPGHQPCGP